VGAAGFSGWFVGGRRGGGRGSGSLALLPPDTTAKGRGNQQNN
jgi:hypothetical protein